MLRPILRGLPLRTLCPPRCSSSSSSTFPKSAPQPQPFLRRQLTSTPASHTASPPSTTHPPPDHYQPTSPSPTPTSPQPHTSQETQTQPQPPTITVTLPLPPAPPGPPPRETPYTVTRTASNNLPVYQTAKAGGNLRLTLVRRVSGDPHALRAHLEAALTPAPKYVRVGGVTGHVVVKGWYKGQVEAFLAARGF